MSRCEYAPEGHGRCALPSGHIGEHSLGGEELSNYTVRFGSFHSSKETFANFVDALATYRAHQSDSPEGASIYGAGYDDESDGLTAEERDEVVG